MKSCPQCLRTCSDEITFCPHDAAGLTAIEAVTDARLAAAFSRRFRIVRRLGEGGMGTVYLAEQVAVGNQPVALKVSSRRLLDDPQFLMRFQDEAASTGRIRHGNVVTIHESGQADDGTPYIAMELLEGESLADAIKRRGALPPIECAGILLQTARGLNAAHKLGIIHRDLKPDNIYLTRDDENQLIVKVVDLGIAKLRESATRTMTGMVLGTPAYMSHEQAAGMKSDQLDLRSDVYSLGIVVYEMLSGRVPFYSDTPLGFLRKHLLEDPPPFRTIIPELPVLPQIEALVMKALAKDRDQRFASALEFAREFSAASAPVRSEALPRTVVAASPHRESEGQAQEKAEAERHAPKKPEDQELAREPVQENRKNQREPELDRGQQEGAKRVSRASGVFLALLSAFVLAGVIWYVSPIVKDGLERRRLDQLQAAERATTTERSGPAAEAAMLNPKDGLKYVWIPPGTFIMGCSPGDNGCDENEKPAHQVTISKGFWMGQTEVTVGAYKRFARGWSTTMPPPEGNWTDDNKPIANVTWDEAHAYCAWMEGRLPSEAEWEYAARAGSTEARYGPLDEVAWHGDKPGDVAQRRANGFGLYDMLGGVDEWVNDYWGWYGDDSVHSQDPQGPKKGDRRIRRGGASDEIPKCIRVSYRSIDDPSNRLSDGGFRCVWQPMAK